MGSKPSHETPETPANTIFDITRLRTMDINDLIIFFRWAKKFDAELYKQDGGAWATARINKQNAAEEIRRRAEQKKKAAQQQQQTQLSF